jgi:hypothetical protein
MSIWLLFCSQQEIYKSLIRSTYDDYICVVKELKYAHQQPSTEMNKKELQKYYTKRNDIRDELIELLKIYCRKYPSERICEYIHFKTYDEYPYRLHQNISSFMKLL